MSVIKDLDLSNVIDEYDTDFGIDDLSVHITEKKSPKVDMRDSIKKIVIPVEDYFQIPSVPFQRFTEGRANLSKVKKSLSKLRAEHLNVDIACLTKDDEYFGQKYPANTYFIINGNTRRYYWENNLSDKIPQDVYATIYYFDTLNDMRISYNTFDSMNAVERMQEKLYGILHGVHGFMPTCTKLEKGQIISALNLACHFWDKTTFNQPNVSDELLPLEISLFLEEIKKFDSVCTKPKNWDQALTCAALMALKLYGTTNKKLLECLEKINNRAMDTTAQERDGVTFISYEWTTHQRFRNKGTLWDKDSGLKNCTSFILYWIEHYMQDNKLTQMGKYWEETGYKFFDKYKASVNNLNNLFNFPPKQIVSSVSVKTNKPAPTPTQVQLSLAAATNTI
ncbi:hypothetical protein UFOVP257_360 [uncultured Caudovirales phage]|uniref:Uncharacterized protein n=1 Tax=uncultured Caudovirales phage TaxID=2100421 RepID=A0A6J5LG10_9CAUD|nr:hypothetical protein UFOVP257_360 [uncultured Caudovirales phage]